MEGVADQDTESSIRPRFCTWLGRQSGAAGGRGVWIQKRHIQGQSCLKREEGKAGHHEAREMVLKHYTLTAAHGAGGLSCLLSGELDPSPAWMHVFSCPIKLLTWRPWLRSPDPFFTGILSSPPTLTMYPWFGECLSKTWPSCFYKLIFFSVNLTFLTPNIILNLHSLVSHFLSSSQLNFVGKLKNRPSFAGNIDKVRAKTGPWSSNWKPHW